MYSTTNIDGDTFEWFLDGTLIESTSTNSYNASQEGSYTVIAYLQGCESPQSEAVVLDEPLSIDGSKVFIYPNPVLNTLKIDSKYSHGNFRIIDLSGKKYLSGTLRTDIDVHKLDEGVYVLVIESGDQIHSQKFTKR